MTATCAKYMTYILFPLTIYSDYLLARPQDVGCILSEPMSKFHTVVTGCAGNIVVGDRAVLTVGSSSTDGKKMKFLT